MKLQVATLLALYSVLEFAADPERHVAAAEIAEKYQVSPHHLAKVLAQLTHAGIVESVRGVGGGYRFIGNARRLTLMDVIALFEDFTSVPLGRPGPGGALPVDRALAMVLSEIDQTARATFSSITVATMLRLVHGAQAAAAEPAPAKPAAAPP
jgi:Rrf2 family protein